MKNTYYRWQNICKKGFIKMNNDEDLPFLSFVFRLILSWLHNFTSVSSLLEFFSMQIICHVFIATWTIHLILILLFYIVKFLHFIWWLIRLFFKFLDLSFNYFSVCKFGLNSINHRLLKAMNLLSLCTKFCVGWWLCWQLLLSNSNLRRTYLIL